MHLAYFATVSDTLKPLTQAAHKTALALLGANTISGKMHVIRCIRQQEACVPKSKGCAVWSTMHTWFEAVHRVQAPDA